MLFLSSTPSLSSRRSLIGARYSLMSAPSSSTCLAIEAALSRSTTAPTDAEAFPLFLEALRQAAPALVASASGRDDGEKAIAADDDDTHPSLSPFLRLASPESRSAYDLALRSALARAMASALHNGEPFMVHDASGSANGGASTVRRLLTVASSAASSAAAAAARSKNSGADPSAATATLFSALEDLLEGTPVDQASEAFAALEQAASEPLRRLGWDRCKLPLLRACNGLLARASRRRSPRECGAVLLFLARAAPLGDKSGLNLMGTCNSASHPVPVEEVDREKLVDSSGERIDSELYKEFWKLQRFLQSPLPTLLVPSASSSSVAGSTVTTTKGEAVASSGPEAANWAEFQASVRAVLGAFRKTPVAVDAAGGSKVAAGASFSPSSTAAGKGKRLGSASAKRRSSAGGAPQTTSSSSASASSAAVGVSYLSSPSIFGLQLRDGAVRRHFLVQVLIALHALRHPPQRLGIASGGAAAAAAAGGAATATASAKVSPPRAKQLAEADSLETLVLSALELVPPEGRKYAGAVRAALAREGSWAAWKGCNPPCPSLEKAPLAKEKLTPSRSDGDTASPSSLPPSTLSSSLERKPGGLGARGPPTLGTPDLDRLWSLTPSNGAGLRAADRGVVPTAESFLEPVLSEMDPEEGIEDFYKTQKDQVYQWKALRQIAASDWRAFATVVASPGASDLEAGAAAMFPSRVPNGWVSLAAKEEAKAKLKKEEEERKAKEKEEAAAAEAAEKEAAAAAAKAAASKAATAAKVKEEEEKGGAAAAAAVRAGGKRKRDSDDGEEEQKEKEEPAAAAEEEAGDGENICSGGGEVEMPDAEEEGEGEQDGEEREEEEAAASPLAAPAADDADAADADAADADAAADAPLSQRQQQQSDNEEEGMEVEEEEGREEEGEEKGEEEGEEKGEGALSPEEDEGDRGVGDDGTVDEESEEPSRPPRSEGALEEEEREEEGLEEQEEEREIEEGAEEAAGEEDEG